MLVGSAVEAVAALLHGRMNALAEAAAPPAYRGRYLAAFHMAFTIAALLAPAVVGLSSHGAALPWLIVAPVSTTAALTYPALGRILPIPALARDPSVVPGVEQRGHDSSR